MNKIIKYATLIYAGVILLGYISQYFYYRLFDININEYYTISDFLFSGISILLDNSLYLLLICCILFLVYLLIYIIPQGRKHIEPNRRKNSVQGKLKKYIVIYQVNIVTYFAIFLMTVLIIFYTFYFPYFIFYNGFPFLEIVFILGLITLSLIMLYHGYIENKRLWKSDIVVPAKNLLPVSRSSWTYLAVLLYKGRKDIIMGIVYLSLIFFITLCRLDIGRDILIKNEHQKYIVFRYENNVIKSTKYSFYVGSTFNYVFFYDSHYKKTILYERNRIQNMEHHSTLKYLELDSISNFKSQYHK